MQYHPLVRSLVLALAPLVALARCSSSSSSDSTPHEIAGAGGNGSGGNDTGATGSGAAGSDNGSLDAGDPGVLPAQDAGLPGVDGSVDASRTECGAWEAGPLLGYCVPAEETASVALAAIPQDICADGELCIPKTKVDPPGDFAACVSAIPISGDAVCVPTYLVEAPGSLGQGYSSVLGQVTCAPGESCAPCMTAFGQPSGFCGLIPPDSGPVVEPCPDADLGSALGMGVATGTTTGRNDSYSSAWCAQGDAPDVTYTWTAPANGFYVFDLRGSDYDTQLIVINGCQGGELACDDDTFAQVSRVEYTVTDGEAIAIVVDGNGSSSGSYSLNIAAAAPEDCGNAIDDDIDELIDCADPDCGPGCTDGG